MKTSQIAVGASYENKRTNTVRTVTGIFLTEKGGKVVEYTEHPSAKMARPLYWPLRRLPQMPLAEFAAWAARPVGAKNPFKNWKGGPEYHFAKSR